MSVIDDCSSGTKPVSVADWYADRYVFVTGSTGFMGKVLVEKLLRCCPRITAIYLLIRPKRGKRPPERLQELLRSPAFDLIRSSATRRDCNLDDGDSNGNVLDKLRCVEGDVTVDDGRLGILDDEIVSMLRTNVTVVFHAAANVRFDQPLKEELTFNVRGTRNVLEFCRGMNRLDAYVHVSTTFCHCDRAVLEEQFYPAPQDPLKMLDLITWLDDDLLIAMTPHFLNGAPNTYAYSKCLAEQLVNGYAIETRMPVIIARPSIVLNAWKEPKPGWVDNLNGPTGIVVAAGKGVIRTMHCNAAMNCDGVPVDMAVNGLIVTAKVLAEEIRREREEEMVTEEENAYGVQGPVKKGRGAKFVNVSLGDENPVTWNTALEVSRKHFYANPFSVMLWYPDGGPKRNRHVHEATAFFTHTIPAYLIDFLLMMGRQKPFMVKLHKRIKVGLEILSYYTVRQWYFPNGNLKRIRESLSPKDREIFYTDFEQIDWTDYFRSFILGAREFCVGEDPSTLPMARKTLKRLYYINQLKNLIVYGLLFWFFYVCTSWLKNWTDRLHP